MRKYLIVLALLSSLSLNALSFNPDKEFDGATMVSLDECSLGGKSMVCVTLQKEETHYIAVLDNKGLALVFKIKDKTKEIDESNLSLMWIRGRSV